MCVWCGRARSSFFNHTSPRFHVNAPTLASIALALSSLPFLPLRDDDTPPTFRLESVGTYASGLFDAGGAEIVAHDPRSQRLFVVNAEANSVDVLDVSDPASPVLHGTIQLAPYGAGTNSVAVHEARRDGDRRSAIVAVAVEAADKQAPGRVAFFDVDGNALSSVEVGALPDMLVFTPDGRFVLVANEGEPSDDYTVDPAGSVSVIDVSRGVRNLTQADVRTAGFEHLDAADLPGVRLFGPGASVAQDLEPEYITVSADSRQAWVTLQENNALARLDIRRARVLDVVALGTKDHAAAGNELDPSDRDGAIALASWPVRGYYLPDAIASYRVAGRTFLVTANEGDARDYDGFGEEARVKDLVLDPTAFPDAATLRLDANLGRLRVTTTAGDHDDDGDFDALFSFGARSFSIWSAAGELVYDSGDDLERLIAAELPAEFNSGNDENDSFDSRSDDKGPEPEGLAIGRVAGHWLLCLGLERVGGVALFDISDPRAPRFLDYLNTRDFTGSPEDGTAGDLGPEGLAFIDAHDSPTGEPMLAVGNEVSGTTTLFRIVREDGDDD
jgi:hypothetical protein